MMYRGRGVNHQLALAAAMATLGVAMPAITPKPARKSDPERMAAAIAKRERKAKRRAHDSCGEHP